MSRLFSILLLLFGAFGILAQDDTNTLSLDLQADPTILHGEDGRFTDPGAVFAHDGQFHMFRNRFAEFPGAVEIHYHTSTDGITWEPTADDPVITPDEVPYDVVGVFASSALVEDDGTWVLYLYAFPADEAGLGEGGYIVRATADDPLGDWTFDEEPLLLPGDTDAWDSFRVTAPSVIKQADDEYVMLYEGIGPEFTDRFIGLARSTDGITWEKHGDPVFKPELGWENEHTHQPRVVATPEGLMMLYRSYSGPQRMIAFGLATSNDAGETWQRLTIDAPLVEQGRASNFQPIWYSALAYDDGLFAAPLELGASGGGTHIHAATFTLTGE